jgi:hypothetical protein
LITNGSNAAARRLFARFVAVTATAVVVAGGIAPVVAHAVTVGSVSVQKGSPALNNGTHTVVLKGSVPVTPGSTVAIKLTRDISPGNPSTASQNALSATGTVGSDFQTVTATVNFALANPGSYAAAIYEGNTSTGQQIDACDSCFTVLSPAPTVTGVSPSTLGAMTTSDGFGTGNQIFGFQPFVISGQSFAKGLYTQCTTGTCVGPSVAVYKTNTSTFDDNVTLGQTIASNGNSAPTGPTATSIALRVTVGPDATAQDDDVVVTNSDGQSSTCVACLHIHARPTITSVENAGLTPGAGSNQVGDGATDATLNVYGDNFPNDASAFAFHTSSQTDSPGSISWTVAAPVSDPTGGDPARQRITLTHVNTTNVNDIDSAWQVIVTSASEHSLSAGSPLTVTAAPKGTGLTYVDTNHSATQYGQGATDAAGDNVVKVDVTVNRASYYAGSGVTPHTTVQFTSLPGGVQVTDEVAKPLPVSGDGTVEATLAIGQNGSTPDPTAGTYHLVVVNPDGGRSATCTTPLPAMDNCFLTVATGPKVTGVSNNFQPGGSSTSVTITSAGAFPSGTGAVHVRIGPANAPFVDGDFTRVGDTDPTGTHHNQVVATGVTVPNAQAIGDYPVVVTDVDDRGTYTVADGFHVVALAVSGVSPNFSLNNSSAKSLAITGASFTNDATAVLHPSFLPAADTSLDIAGTNPAVTNGGTTLTSTFNLLNRSPGDYDVVVTQTDGSGGCSQCFALFANAPTIGTKSPSPLGRGATNVLVTVTGTNIYPGATLSFSDPAVHLVGTPTVTGTTQISQMVSVDPGTAQTTADQNDQVTVTDTHPSSDVDAPDWSSSTGYPISAGPSVSTISPSTRAAGSPATTFTITGTGFDPNNAAVDFSDNGVTLTSISRSATQITGTLHIASNVATDAPVGVDVTVVNPADSGAATSPTQLTVDPQPVVDGVDPGGVATGSKTTLVISGSNFFDGVTVAPHTSGSGLTFDTPVVQSPNEVDVPVTVASNAPLGNVTLDLTNPDAGATSTPLDIFTTPSNVTNLAISGRDGVIDVAWNAPTSNGGNPISSYTVTASDHANPAQSPDPITVQDPCTDASVSQTFCAEFQGLDAGTRYDVTVVPSNDAGNGPAVGAAVTPKYASVLTIGTSRNPIVYGKSATLSGTLSRPNGPAVGAGEPVAIYRQPPSSGAVKIATVQTAAGGDWSFSVSPAHNTSYYASYGGAADTATAATPLLLEKVASKVTVTSPSANNDPLVNPKNTDLTVKGAVTPDQAGQQVHLVYIHSGSRTTLQTVKLNSKSRYTFDVPLSKGTWNLVVTIGKTAGNVAGQSRTFTVKQQ